MWGKGGGATEEAEKLSAIQMFTSPAVLKFLVALNKSFIKICFAIKNLAKTDCLIVAFPPSNFGHDLSESYIRGESCVVWACYC